MKIAVLAGGSSCEREISLISGKAVADALASLGHEVISVDPTGDFLPLLKKQGVAVAFIALHGTFGEDGIVQKLLEQAGIPYTGSGPRSSEIAFDKAHTQAIFKKEGICIPEFIVLKAGDKFRTPEGISYPVVVKPSKAGSSVGVSLVASAAELDSACRDAFRYSDTIIVERYIRGRELTVGILGTAALPVVEVIAGRTFYDYEAKYKDAATRYEFPAKLTVAQTNEVTRVALEAFHALGCEVMARVDFILGDDDRAYALEVNTIPGLTGKSLLPKAAKAAGIDFPSLCVRIIELSLKRKGAKDPVGKAG